MYHEWESLFEIHHAFLGVIALLFAFLMKTQPVKAASVYFSIFRPLCLLLISHCNLICDDNCDDNLINKKTTWKIEWLALIRNGSKDYMNKQLCSDLGLANNSSESHRNYEMMFLSGRKALWKE